MNSLFELENSSIKWIRLRNTSLFAIGLATLIHLVFDDSFFTILVIVIFSFLIRSFQWKNKEVYKAETKETEKELIITSSNDWGITSQDTLPIEVLRLEEIKGDSGITKRVMFFKGKKNIAVIPNRTIKKSRNEVNALLSCLKEMQAHACRVCKTDH